MSRFVIDTDTASDDAVALLMALRDPAVTVEAITVVAGNVPLRQAVQNALYTAELAGADVPVHAGLARPLLVELATAQHVHGIDGMGDLGLPLTGREPAPGHGVDVLIDVLRGGDITLVTLGPLTNVAVALLREPALAQAVMRCVVMGGASDSRGNITPLAEYNFWADPHAAQIVLQSGLPLEIVGWDISRKHAVLVEDDLDALRALGPLGTFAADINRAVAEFATTATNLAGPDFPDPIAMAVALDPAVATVTEELPVSVDVGDGIGRGQMVVDHTRLTGAPGNARVVLEASRERFMRALHAGVA